MSVQVKEYLVILVLICCLFPASFGLGNVSGRGGSYRSGYKAEPQKQVYNGLGYANGDFKMKHASDGKPTHTKAQGGIGLSAWGIIGVILGIGGMGTICYYTVIFYPILCKKERKYDIMELNSV